MAEERGMEVIVSHEEYSGNERRRRKQNLTEEDLTNIAVMIEKVLQHKVHSDAACRFVGITPDDLRTMVESHKKFNSAMDDSKSIVRRFVIVLILTSLSSVIIFGFWEKVISTVKKALAGN